jgi:5-methyltetrahydropteroyltriglutamate--homocysteine methyltransferase
LAVAAAKALAIRKVEETMKTSEGRILTTHAGSLPRTDKLAKLLIERDNDVPVDDDEMRREVERAIDWLVAKQLDSGVDIGSDGEAARVGFQTYVSLRLSGWGGVSPRKGMTDIAKFPKYGEILSKRLGRPGELTAKLFNCFQCQHAVHYQPDLADAKMELRSFAETLKRNPKKFAETFVTAASPGIITTTFLRDENNPDYKTDKDYVYGVAKEMKKEYDYIVSQGHILQIDAPDLAMERAFMFQDRPLGDFLDRIKIHVDAMNRAIADIPPEKVRLHVCFGNWDGPHIDDVELAPLLPIIYKAKVGAISIACANPRHQHDWKTLKKNPPPRGIILIPGVVDVTTNYLEHPEVVADRIELFVDVMGGDRSRVIAGTDCGFSTVAGYMMVAEDVVWAKLRALADGTSIASRRLRRVGVSGSPAKRSPVAKGKQAAAHKGRRRSAKGASHKSAPRRKMKR